MTAPAKDINQDCKNMNSDKKATLMHALFDGYMQGAGMGRREAAILAYNSVLWAARAGHGGVAMPIYTVDYYLRPEKAYWIRAEFNGRNVVKLAQKYDVSRSTVYRVLKRGEDVEQSPVDSLDAFLRDVGAE